MNAALIAVAAIWGAATGLLLPRAAYRMQVESGEPWRTTCPAGHPITGPARGWLGPARSPDGTRYGPRPLPTALVTALVCLSLAATAGARPELAVWLLVTPVMVLLTMTDYAVHRLPDVLTVPFAAAALVLLGATALLPAAGGSWPTALFGGLALGAAYFVLFLINPNGMGFGDVKLAAGLGIVLGWYGWTVLIMGALAGLTLGALYGLVLMLLRRGTRKTAIPLGPFMVAGTLLGVWTGALGAGG